MRLDCIRKVRKNGIVGYVWHTNFKITLENPIRPLSQIRGHIIKFEQLAPTLSYFLEWASMQDNCPTLGPVCSIEVSPSYLDENGVLLLGKVLRDLRKSFYQVNPKKADKEAGI